MIKIVIADDQVLLRKSIGQLISIDPDINVVAMVGNGAEAIMSCERYQPDIVLMDIEMPEMNGIAALNVIKEKFEDIKVIMLTTFENKDNVIDAIMADADGYIIKDIGCEELITTIKCVNNGLTVIHKSVKKIVMTKFSRMSEHSQTYTELLSLEEVDIVKMIVDGMSNKAIAGVSNYTEGTIKNKVSKIYDKLGISDRLQLAVYAVENGIE